jgi:hypothetical protein
MDRNFPPDYYQAGTKVIFEDGTNDILGGTNYLSPGNYYLGKKIVAIDISEIPDKAVNQTAEQRRIAEARAEIDRQAAEQGERMARERRERAARMDREVAEQAVRRREWEAGAEAREERRRIEAARPYDNNNPAPPNDEAGPDGRPHWHQPGLHWGGRKSRRGRKNKKSRKRRSMKRRVRKTNRRRGRR